MKDTLVSIPEKEFYQEDLTQEPDLKKEGKSSDKKSKNKDVGDFSYTRLLSLARDYYWLIALGSLCALAGGAALPMFNVVFGNMIDVLVNCYGDASCIETRTHSIIVYVLMFLGLGVGSFILIFIQNMCFIYFGEQLSTRLRISYYRALMQQDVAFYDKNKSGELGSRLTGDVLLVQNGTSDKLGMSLFFGSQMISSLIVAFVKSWSVTLVVLSISPLIIIAGFAQTSALTSQSAVVQRYFAKSSQIASESLSSYRTVLSFVRSDYEVDRYKASLVEVIKKTKAKNYFQAFGFAFSYFIIFAAYMVAFGYGGSRVLRGTLEIGTMFTVFFSVTFGAFGLGQFAQISPDLAKAKGAAIEIFKTIDSVPEIKHNDDKGYIPTSLEGMIQFDNVSFSYPGRPEVRVLDNLSIVCEPGKTIALVGSSGCGKSTTVALLERFYNPNEGEILIDNRNIKDYNLKALREHIGLVAQEPILFASSIRENIRYGRLDATEEEIIEASKQANAYNFIMELPQKFETEVGEKGTQLSGGQKQRVAIARAILKNPKILLLDEATSALDSESEALVQEALERLMAGRTSVVIAHRLSTIQNADRIYVLAKGRVVEYGTHQELLAKNQHYYQLATRQVSES